MNRCKVSCFFLEEEIVWLHYTNLCKSLLLKNTIANNHTTFKQSLYGTYALYRKIKQTLC